MQQSRTSWKLSVRLLAGVRTVLKVIGLSRLRIVGRRIVGRGNPSSKNATAALRELEAPIRMFAELPRELEQRFLAIGRSMEQLPDASDRLIACSDTLHRLNDGDAGGHRLLKNAMDSLEAPLRFIEECEVGTSEMLDQLSATEERITQILTGETRLQRTVAPLKYLRTMFKVESSRLCEQTRTMFLALTEQTESLRIQVTDTFSEKFEGLRSMRAVIQSVRNSLQEGIRERRKIVRRDRDVISALIGNLNEELAGSNTRAAQLHAGSGSVASGVGKLVMSLQAQDIISQKSAHVVEVLASLPREYEAATRSLVSRECVRQLGGLLAATRAEEAQVKAIHDDIHQTEAGLSEAVAHVRTEIRKLEEAPIEESAEITSECPAARMVRRLSQLNNGVGELVDGEVREIETVHAALEPLGGQTSNLATVMHQLSAEIHCVGLNAQVQAALVGEGTGLEILAASTTQVAAETSEISREIAGQLDAFVGGLNDIVASFGRLSAEGRRQLTRFQADTHGRDAALRTYAEETEVCLKGIDETSHHILSLLEAMDREVVQLRQSDSVLGPLLESLAALGAELDRTMAAHRAAGFTDADAPIVPVVRRRYTMEAERLVHEAALRGGRVETASLASRAETVEFFDADTDVQAEAPSADEPVPAGVDNDVPSETEKRNSKGPAVTASANEIPGLELF